MISAQMNIKNQWPPTFLKEYAARQLASATPLTDVQKLALQRFISVNLINQRLLYYSLRDQHPQAVVDQYFIEVYEFYLDVELFQPCRQIDHKDWLRKLTKESGKVAATVSSPPSSSISLPSELSNVNALILACLTNFGDEITIAQFEEIDPYLKRTLQKIPISLLLDTVAQVAQRELGSPPIHYWESEYGIKAPSKHGEGGKIAYEQIMIKGVKKITRKVFNAPHHEVVATLVNTLLETDFTADSISKTPV